ncbi:putative transcriptional regulatory protein TetR [Nocardioides sp. LS1]|nr:putative transcriptional regulatory protein TetR [Nocardioides sp. LS1]
MGRPPATSHAAIEETAFALFEANGFDATTMDDIATAVGVGRRTLFRYYPSKNDILWGQFDDGLRSFRDYFAQVPIQTPIATAIRDAIMEFNSLDPAATDQHRRRMRFLLQTPALLAHSELRYAAWRRVVAEFVAARLDCTPDDLLPSLAGRVALAIALSAYEHWLQDATTSLPILIAQASDGLGELLDPIR